MRLWLLLVTALLLYRSTAFWTRVSFRIHLLTEVRLDSLLDLLFEVRIGLLQLELLEYHCILVLRIRGDVFSFVLKLFTERHPSSRRFEIPFST